MATKQEIVSTIQAGIDQVQQTFGSLSDEQLETTVYDGDGGWTAKEILAHLASRRPGYERMIGVAEGSASFPTGNVDFNAMNQTAVDQIVGQSRDDLLAQFREVHEGLKVRVQGLPDDLLGKTISLPMGDRVLGDVLLGSGGRHSINHSVDVEKAIADRT
jgi:hypothetical protein